MDQEKRKIIKDYLDSFQRFDHRSINHLHPLFGE